MSKAPARSAAPGTPAASDASGDWKDLLALRAEFPILQKTTYLVNHSLGAMPRKVHDRLREFATLWETRGIRAWAEGWWTSPTETGDLVGRILDAPPGTVVMHQNVSVIMGLVASALEFKAPRNRVVYSELNFPSVMYVWEAQRRRGAEITMVKSRDGVTVDTDDFLAALDERTLIVPLSHVLFQSSYLQDLQAIVRRAHEVGAIVLADCYQSAGCVPFSVQQLDLDMAAGGSVKWLCGGPGAGYLYCKPELRDRLEPALTGWMAHEHPFAFEKGPQKYAHDATRLLHGSPAVPSLYAARSGYELILQAGVENIRRKSVAQTQRFLQRAAAAGLTSKSPPDPARRGGSVTVQVPHAPAVVAALAERDILLDCRPDVGLRLSPHYYNTDEELDACLDAVLEILKTGAWQKHAQKDTAY